MSKDRHIELINAGIDGELNNIEQQELETLLEQSEHARREHSGSSALARLLGKVEVREVPAGLHSKIVDAIRLPSGKSRFSFFSRGEMPSLMRFGVATAAAMLLAVGLYSGREDIRHPGDVSSMVGTISRGAQDSQTRVLDTFSFEKDGANAQISLEQRGGSYVLDVQMDADRPLEFQVDWSRDLFQFDSFSKMQSSLDSTQFKADAIHVTGVGPQRFAILLQRAEDSTAGATAGISVDFSSGGEVIQQGRIDPGW
jgi:hypothetical protein